VITGFEQAVRVLIPEETRKATMVLYYGFSTGGAYLWPLATRLQPDGIAGYGMSNFPISYFSRPARAGNYDWLYEHSVTRLRERGTNDFAFYNRDIGEAEQAEHWQRALKAPRFKSYEDTFMFFNIASLAETIARLWNAPFVPDEVRKRGLSDVMRENIDLSFPNEGLGAVRALDLYGTRDEVLTPDVARGVEKVVAPYCASYRMAFLDGYHHSVSADHAEAFGSLWLDAIRSGYYHRA
jgi:hypothetical protein